MSFVIGSCLFVLDLFGLVCVVALDPGVVVVGLLGFRAGDGLYPLLAASSDSEFPVSGQRRYPGSERGENRSPIPQPEEIAFRRYEHSS